MIDDGCRTIDGGCTTSTTLPIAARTLLTISVRNLKKTSKILSAHNFFGHKPRENSHDHERIHRGEQGHRHDHNVARLAKTNAGQRQDGDAAERDNAEHERHGKLEIKIHF